VIAHPHGSTKQNHLDDALDLNYLTAEQDAELFKLADRAIGGTTRLLERRTPSPEPRTKNEP
jgi:hypothetical protein